MFPVAQCACGCGRSITFMDTFDDIVFVDFQTSYWDVFNKSFIKDIKRAYKRHEDVFNILLRKEDVEKLMTELSQLYYKMIDTADFGNHTHLYINYINEIDLIKDEEKYFEISVTGHDVKLKDIRHIFNMKLSKKQVNDFFTAIKREYESVFGPIQEQKKKQILLEDCDD